MCDGLINLGRPTRSERVRDFQPPWRTVFIYECPKCGHEVRVRAGAFIGKRPVPGVGAIRCTASPYVTDQPDVNLADPPIASDFPPQQENA